MTEMPTTMVSRWCQTALACYDYDEEVSVIFVYNSVRSYLKPQHIGDSTAVENERWGKERCQRTIT